MSQNIPIFKYFFPYQPRLKWNHCAHCQKEKKTKECSDVLCNIIKKKHILLSLPGGTLSFSVLLN